MKTIDITPSWEGVLPTLLILLADAGKEGKKVAHEELLKMARAADLYNKGVK